jgi:hypothetical protein
VRHLVLWNREQGGLDGRRPFGRLALRFLQVPAGDLRNSERQQAA